MSERRPLAYRGLKPSRAVDGRRIRTGMRIPETETRSCETGFEATVTGGHGICASACSIKMSHPGADLPPETHGNPSPQARWQAGASSVRFDLDGKWNGWPHVASGVAS